MLLATLLAIALGASPAAVRTAFAAGTLRVQADAVYTLDPEAGRVHVEIDVRATNLKPNTASLIYYYRETGFALQAEASSIRASDSRGSISITTRKRESFIEAVVRFRADLLYQRTTSFTIRYDLVGGAPRSASPIRVGQAFATFGVWAWGDPGRSTVEVRTPPGFENRLDGDSMAVVPDTSGQTLRTTNQDPDTFFAIVSSENRAAYGQTRISLAGGVEIVVQAWPEDDAWDETVTETLRAGMPELRALIGLDWPVQHDLQVRERYTPALEGYAGIFFTEEQRIDVSEDLDPVVIVHEASHAWFNGDLFVERWIYEGLAEEYAWRVLTAIGGDPGPAAERPDPADPGRLALVAWTFPEVIRDQRTDDRERYGYGAAFWVMHEIVDSAGVDQMRAAFAAADANQTAYVGAGPPETVEATDDWRRLLDLVQPIDQPDPVDVEATIRDVAITKIDARALESRGPARERYRALLETGDGWLPPWYVRRQMGTWTFVGATKAMDQATAVLALRDEVSAAAEAIALEPDDALRVAYEGTQDRFDGATAIANDQLAALAAVAEARAMLEAAPDLIVQVGLLGETPAVPYEAARAAFEAGQLEQALAAATSATAIITGAQAIGQQRLLLAVGVALAVLLVLVLLAVLLRRRGRHRPVMAVALAAEPSALPPAPSALPPAPDTLAADPATAPAPPSASPPDVEGGPERRDAPADP